jgi:hypothetical protein
MELVRITRVSLRKAQWGTVMNAETQKPETADFSRNTL